MPEKPVLLLTCGENIVSSRDNWLPVCVASIPAKSQPDDWTSFLVSNSLSLFILNVLTPEVYFELVSSLPPALRIILQDDVPEWEAFQLIITL